MEYKLESQICQNCKKDFTIESDDFAFYEKIKVPPPTFCPECRMQRRLAWRNERNFSHSMCKMCGDKIISIYSNKNISVFCQNCWFSDKWDASSFGIDYNFDKSFFEQFSSLFYKVPQVNLNGHASNINSPYVNYVVQVKNSYFCFGGGFSENIMFSNLGINCKDSVEIYFSNFCEYCYEISNCDKCYHVNWGRNLKDCMNSFFLEDSTNCNECIMCCNLKNKIYCYKNKQYIKEEYEKIKKEFLNILKSNPDILKKEFKDFLIKYPKKYANIIKSESCTGNNISESSNVYSSFNIRKAENLKNCVEVLNQVKDIYDSNSIGLNTQNVYETLTGSVNVSNVISSCIIRNNSFDISYSYFMTSCSNCFACIGLKNKQYCILNKQYTKEEYEEMVPKIIKHMNEMPYISERKNPSTGRGQVYKYGEFFPSELSPFCYNETIAQEYFPLTKEQAKEQGYKWKDKEERNYQIDIYNKDIPDDIKDVNDEIIGKVIECAHSTGSGSSTHSSPSGQAHKDCNEQCTEAFKIIPEELQFYRRMNLPLPRLCPNCRHYQRLKQRNPMKLWHRRCMKEGCTNEFETSYAPDRPEIIYCERCYQQEVY